MPVVQFLYLAAMLYISASFYSTGVEGLGQFGREVGLSRHSGGSMDFSNQSQFNSIAHYLSLSIPIYLYA